ncbi:TetR/AcrR family transcriptional regulator [Streptomyces sp. NPDC058457]|uniref:TetR/AcrR family transcriptional regulator n=1 Tax=Streptomyces sp. NPDC058457 TaxID=3346507 RepID=UPI00365A4B9A
MASTPQERRAARHHQPVSDASPKRGRRAKPITVDAIIEVALDIVAREGYPALTMRRVATALDTGSASLYAHVVNKEDLDELLIGRLCAEIDLPEPDPATWRAQITGVCAQVRDQYLRYPGISRAALAAAPTNNDTLRLAECMLALLLAGGVAPQSAAWGMDALSLYINSYTLEISLLDRSGGEWAVSRDDMLQRLADLPDTFPHTKRHAAELTAGTDHERFDFTIDLILDGLTRRS